MYLFLQILYHLHHGSLEKPQPPLNFIGYSYASRYINFIWLSNYNGGPEQFFVLSQRKGSSWIKVTTLTDPGEGNFGYYDLGPINPGQEYWYRLKSCNRINCSRPAEVKVTVEGRSTYLKAPSDQNIWIAVGVLAGIFVLLLTHFGVYKFAHHRAIATVSIQPPQPSSDLKTVNREYDDVNDVTVAARDQVPPQTYEDIIEKCTEQSTSLTDYQNTGGFSDNQYEELKPEENRLYTSLDPKKL